MIVTGIGTDIYNYYNLEKKIVSKAVFDPKTETYNMEYVQYYYNKVGELHPTKSVGLNVDKYS
jgi:hypothetical protein